VSILSGLERVRDALWGLYEDVRFEDNVDEDKVETLISVLDGLIRSYEAEGIYRDNSEEKRKERQR
jgi:hypothetical protein